MLTKLSQTLNLSALTLALVLLFGASYALAWTAPTAPAPGGNAPAPLNTSVTAQTKAGALTLGTVTAPTSFTTIGSIGATGDICTTVTGSSICLSTGTGGGGGGGGGFGPGYAWQNVAASRTLGTTYTNSTSNPIVVSVSTSNTGTCQMFSYVNSVLVGYSSDSNAGFAGSCGGLDTIVPSGQTYSVTGRAGSTIYSWAELRCDSGVNCSSGGGSTTGTYCPSPVGTNGAYYIYAGSFGIGTYSGGKFSGGWFQFPDYSLIVWNAAARSTAQVCSSTLGSCPVKNITVSLIPC